MDRTRRAARAGWVVVIAALAAGCSDEPPARALDAASEPDPRAQWCANILRVIELDPTSAPLAIGAPCIPGSACKGPVGPGCTGEAWGCQCGVDGVAVCGTYRRCDAAPDYVPPEDVEPEDAPDGTAGDGGQGDAAGDAEGRMDAGDLGLMDASVG